MNSTKLDLLQIFKNHETHNNIPLTNFNYQIDNIFDIFKVYIQNYQIKFNSFDLQVIKLSLISLLILKKTNKIDFEVNLFFNSVFAHIIYSAVSKNDPQLLIKYLSHSMYAYLIDLIDNKKKQ